MHDFATFVHDRTLVSVRRDAIDQNKIQGFVLAASESLFLLQYVYDFNLDGLMVLRTTDVTDLKSSKTEEFQRTLLEEEGLISKVPFGTKVDLSSWHAVIAEFSRQFPLMILKCEDQEEPDFAVGRILELGEEEVRLLYFTGAARWLDDPVAIKFNQITTCQVNTNYVNVYQRYFELNAP